MRCQAHSLFVYVNVHSAFQLASGHEWQSLSARYSTAE